MGRGCNSALPITSRRAQLLRSTAYPRACTDGMTWKPSEDVDQSVREWMKAKGWEVTRTNYDSDRKVYAWRHDLPGGKPTTLRISQKVLEDYPAFIVVHHLEELKVARAIRALPEARLVVVQHGSKVTLAELPNCHAI